MPSPAVSPPLGDVATDRRFPRGWFARGIEPDPRFTLANERTCLAWIRTSLSCFGAWSAAVCAGGALAAAFVGLLGRRRADRANIDLLSGHGIPGDGRLLVCLASLVSAVAGLAVLFVVRLEVST